MQTAKMLPEGSLAAHWKRLLTTYATTVPSGVRGIYVAEECYRASESEQKRLKTVKSDTKKFVFEVRIRKVESSILFVSTKKSCEINGFTGFFIFCNSNNFTGVKLSRTHTVRIPAISFFAEVDLKSLLLAGYSVLKFASRQNDENTNFEFKSPVPARFAST